MRKFIRLILAMLLALTCVFTLVACADDGASAPPPSDPPPVGPPPHTHSFTQETYLVDEGNAYKVKLCDCGDYEVLETLVGALIATPETLANVISTAVANSTVVLDSGYYSTLYLVGKNAYPQNLTVIGAKDVTLNGVSITSGIKYEKVITDSTNSAILNETMVAEATINGNLTFKNITFGRTVAIRNANIDGFTLYDCKFINSSGIVINANTFCDYYGNDTTNGNKVNVTRNNYCVLYTKNVRIENCSLRNVDYSGSQQDTAIIVHSVENITIKKCVVDGAKFNAVQINGIGNAKTKGTILLESNTFKYTNDRLLRFNSVEAGSTITLKYNILEGSGNASEIMKASSVTGVEFNFYDNTYDGYSFDRYSSGVIIE